MPGTFAGKPVARPLDRSGHHSSPWRGALTRNARDVNNDTSRNTEADEAPTPPSDVALPVKGSDCFSSRPTSSLSPSERTLGKLLPHVPECEAMAPNGRLATYRGLAGPTQSNPDRQSRVFHESNRKCKPFLFDERSVTATRWNSTSLQRSGVGSIEPNLAAIAAHAKQRDRVSSHSGVSLGESTARTRSDAPWTKSAGYKAPISTTLRGE